MGFTQWLNWKKPETSATSADLAGSADAGPAASGEQAQTPEEAAAAVIAKPAETDRNTRFKAQAAIERLEQGYEEVKGVLDAVKTHMHKQDDRSQRMLQLMEGIPHAVQSLPEMTRQQTNLLQSMEKHLERQAETDARLNGTLHELSATNSENVERMEKVENRLISSQMNDQQILQSFESMRGAMNQLNASNEASAGALMSIARRTETSEQQVERLFLSNQKQMATMSVVSWALAIVALTVAGFVAYSVSRPAGPQNLQAVQHQAAPSQTADADVRPVASETPAEPTTAEAATKAPTASASTRGADAEPAAASPTPDVAQPADAHAGDMAAIAAAIEAQAARGRDDAAGEPRLASSQPAEPSFEDHLPGRSPVDLLFGRGGAASETLERITRPIDPKRLTEAMLAIPLDELTIRPPERASAVEPGAD